MRDQPRTLNLTDSLALSDYSFYASPVRFHASLPKNGEWLSTYHRALRAMTPVCMGLRHSALEAHG